MNRLYQKWFGFEPESSVGKTILEVVGTFAREKVKDQIESALLGNHVHFENPVTLMGDGRKTVDLQFIPVWYPTKSAHGFLILGYDITKLASSGLESSTFTRIRGARGTRIGGMRGTIL